MSLVVGDGEGERGALLAVPFRTESAQPHQASSDTPAVSTGLRPRCFGHWARALRPHDLTLTLLLPGFSVEMTQPPLALFG